MTYWNSCKDCSACLLIWKCEALWNTAWISWAQTRCAAVSALPCVPLLCRPQESESRWIRASISGSLIEKHCTPWRICMRNFEDSQSFSHHSTRSSMDRASLLSVYALDSGARTPFGAFQTQEAMHFMSLLQILVSCLYHKELAPHLGSLLTSIVNFEKFRMFLHNQFTTGASGHAQRSRAAEWLPSINSLWELRAYLRPHFLYLRLILTYCIDIIIGWNLFCWLVSKQVPLKVWSS